MKIKILSWNIWGGQFLPEIISLIKSENPDIVCLQEVIQDPDGGNNTAKIIANELGYEWIYEPIHEVDTHILFTRLESKKVIIGNAVLSKYKISSHKKHILSPDEKRIAVEANIDVNETHLNIISTHLVHTHQQDSDLQDLQVINLINAIPKEQSLVMGDFNAVPESNCISIISSVLNNTDEACETPTWSVYPEGCPMCNRQKVDTRLDYIFATKDLKTESFKVNQSKGSDHLPVSVIVEI